MLKGEKVLAQSKRTAPPPISKICSLSICIIEVFQLISYFLYNFKLVWPLQNYYPKPSWTLRGEFHLGGVLFSQRKSIWNRGRKFQILTMLRKILFIYLWLFAKELWKDLQFFFAKTKHVVQAWSKMLKMKKQSMHIL